MQGETERRALVFKDAEQVELFTRVRSLVRRAVQRDLPASGKHGTNQYGDGEDNSNCSPHNASASGLFSRLKRDHPDLAQQVINGDISATRAARKVEAWNFGLFTICKKR